MHKKITTILNSPLGYKYKCAVIYNFIDDKPFMTSFYIGNPKTAPDEACITISVYYTHPENRAVNPVIATLILVKYYEACAENKGLRQGEGTIDMLNTSMSFVKRICSHIKEFKLNDASTKRCDNGSVISLPYFYITQKGQTWYEAHFNAYLEEPWYASYKNAINKMMKYTLPQFDAFNILYIKNTSDKIIDELKTVYTEGDTIKTFFDKLYEKYDKSMACILLQPWIDNFMQLMGLQIYIAHSSWYISIDTVPTYKFTKNNGNIYRVNSYNNTRKRKPWNN
jgi:hypothetical protein